MAKELIYRLNNPGYTIYHRAALGGLAATISAWKGPRGSPPPGITFDLARDGVRLAWGDELTDQQALLRILEASFRLTADKLIDLVGHGIAESESSLRLAIHTGICGTFLQHNKMRPSEKESRKMSIQDADGNAILLTYKAVLAYAHQSAQGTDLLEPAKKGRSKGSFPQNAAIPQSVVPGAMSGAHRLDATAEEAVLLLFLVVGASIFLIRSKTFKDKIQTCVVIPEVSDLVAFSRALHGIASIEIQKHRGGPARTSSYSGRVVGGPEASALRFLIDLAVDDLTQAGITGVRAVSMGRVAWDKNQINRSSSIRIGMNYPELAVFRAADTFLGRTRLLSSKKSEGFAVLASDVPGLVAANLAANLHWALHFRTLVENKKDFKSMLFSQKGLYQMNQVIKDEDDRAIIDAFQEAWRRTMGALSARARRDGLNFDRLLEVERERVRNSILRMKTATSLAGWFLRFCADATKGGSLASAQRDPNRLRRLLFDPRNTDRLQNLFLFGLVSYAKEDTQTTST